jgi:hypothetical protein
MHQRAFLGHLVTSGAVLVMGAAPALSQQGAPIVGGLSRDQVQAVCAPVQPSGGAASVLDRHRDQPERLMFSSVDPLIVEGGTAAGLSVGQVFVVRHRFPVVAPDRPDRVAYDGQRTAGWVRLTEVHDAYALAEAIYACSEFLRGDELHPYEAARAVVASGGVPDFGDPARVIFGDDGRTMAGPTQLLVIDRGRSGGLLLGQSVTLFRRNLGDGGPVSRVAEGLVVRLDEDTATIRLDTARDAVYIGDLVAPHGR